MEVRCHHCGQVQAVGEDVFGNREEASVPCSSCGKTFQIISPKLASFHADATRRAVPAITSGISMDGLSLNLPENQELYLRVIEGREKGTVYPVTKPRITIGRANSDVIINDALSSRIHSSLEVMGSTVLLRDLESTNGTLVNGQRIQTVTLSNGSIFKIGGHSFQLVIIPKGT
ncbi:MAG: FHA domain-containing protein [Terriglobia bacterium]